MVHTSRTIRIGVGMIALALFSTGCSRVRGHQGFIVDNQLVDSVQVGVDNRDSVTKTLGRPTFIGQFDQNDWFYVARNTKQLAFANPRATDQVILRVRFDGAGNVASVEKRGTEQIARISPNSNKTPTLGKESSLLEDLFGNIGQVGAAGAQGQGGTADNPN